MPRRSRAAATSRLAEVTLGQRLMVRQPGFLERVRERVVADVVQQRREAQPQRVVRVERLAVLVEQRERAPREMVGAERVLEPRVGRPGIDEKRVPQLPDVAQALDGGCVEELERLRLEPDVVPERIADDFEPGHALGLGGPASRTAACTCSSNCAKFFRNSSRQSGGLRVVRGRIGPGAARQEHVGGDARHLGGHGESEGRLAHGRRAVELAAERGAHDGPGVREAHPLADAEAAAGPSRIHEPALHAVPGDLLAQHRRVHVGVPRQERSAEAGGEGLLRLGDPALGARDLGGVAREEVVHRLGGGEARDGRHDTERIAREKHDVRLDAPRGRSATWFGMKWIG